MDDQITMTMETPTMSGSSADAYQAARRTLAKAARTYLDAESERDGSGEDLNLQRLANKMSREVRADDWEPRQKITRRDVHRQALLRFCDAITEFFDAEHLDGGALSLNIWDAFQSAVRGEERDAERWGPGDTTWAPEDDTNPIRRSEIPTPDPSAPAMNGVRQGDHVKDQYNGVVRRVLTGERDDGYVRLSDTKDGHGNWGGHWVPADELGRTYHRTEAPND